jgi:outer membrane protein assembly factor BamB
MTVETFIAELERRNLVSDRLVTKLRETLAESKRPLSAKAVADFLVQKKYLSQQQASDVLAGLSQSGLNLDETVEAEDSDEGSGASIFDSRIMGKRNKKKQPASPPAEEDEFGLVPLEDEAPVEKKRKAEVVDLLPDDDVVPLVPLEPIKESPAVRPAKKPSVETAPASVEEPEPIAEVTPSPRVVTSLSRGKKKAKKKSKPTKRKKQWDSPLILWGGGGLAVLLLCGATVYWLLYRETGDQQLAEARAALDSGAYPQAIERYEGFLKDSPRHPEHSSARVQLAMVKIRQPTEANDFSAALATAETELKAIEDEKDFDKAHAELAALLPQIALGLAKQAEKAGPGSDEASQLAEKSNEALALCSNPLYIPKDINIESTLTDVRDTLDKVQRRQQTHKALAETLQSIAQSISDNKPIAAYATHMQLLREHPELSGDAKLAEALQKTTAAEQATVKFVKEEKAAQTADRPAPWVAALAVANRRVKAAAAAGGPSNTAFAQVDGAVYALDVATGRLLWRRYVGFAKAAWPIAVEGDVIITDAAHNELLRVDGASGKLLWRQEIGEPFSEPVIAGERGLVATKSGKLYFVDLKSGARAGYLQFAQPLAVPPTIDRLQKNLYVPGQQAVLYSISLANVSCSGVYYLGHANGSIQKPATTVVDKLALIENDGVETSRLRLLSINDKGVVAKQVTDRRLNGLASQPPLVTGRGLTVVTDRGQIEVYDVAAGEAKEPLAVLATRDATGTQPLMRYVAVVGKNIWLADTQLTKLSILPTGNRLPVEEIQNNYAGATFDQPIAVYGSTLVHVHRPKGRAGVVVGALDTAKGSRIWETDLAIPPAGPPVVDASAKALTVASAEGYLFHFDEAAIRSRVQDEPVPAEQMPTDRPGLSASVDLGQGRSAFTAPNSDRLLLYNPARGPQAAQWIKLESPLACPIAPLSDGFLAPLKIGQVYYLSANDGARIATPFQPRLEPGAELAYKRPIVVDARAARFLLSDGRDKIYLVGLVDQPQPHLEAVAEGNAGPYAIESPFVVLGNSAQAVAGGTHLIRVELPSLKQVGEASLPAPAAWGPFAAGQAILVATADNQLLAVSPTGEITWKAALEHGDLAGAPLVLPDSVVLAYRKGVLERRALADGKPLGAANVEQPLATGPAAFLQKLVLAATDGTLLVVNQP